MLPGQGLLPNLGPGWPLASLFPWAPSQLPLPQRCALLTSFLPHSWNDNSSQNLWGVCGGGVCRGSGEAARPWSRLMLQPWISELGHLTSG